MGCVFLLQILTPHYLFHKKHAEFSLSRFKNPCQRPGWVHPLAPLKISRRRQGLLGGGLDSDECTLATGVLHPLAQPLSRKQFITLQINGVELTPGPQQARSAPGGWGGVARTANLPPDDLPAERRAATMELRRGRSNRPKNSLHVLASRFALYVCNKLYSISVAGQSTQKSHGLS